MNRALSLIMLSCFLSSPAWAYGAGHDRREVIKKYLGEFCSFEESSTIYQAIDNVLQRMPIKTSLKSPTVGVRSFLQNFTIQGQPGLPVLPSLLCYRVTFLVVRRGLL